MRILNKRHWPQKVVIDFDDEKISAAIRWCNDELGKEHFRIIGSNTFYFSSRENAVMFKLSWA